MAAAKAPKRVGKENAPPTAVEEITEGDSFDDIAKTVRPSKPVPGSTGRVLGKSKAAEEDDQPDEPNAAPFKKAAAAPTARSATAVASGSSKRLDQLEAENKRLRSQRDEYAKQFEELSNLRNTAIEQTMDKFKENIGVQTKAKDDIITSLTALNDKLQTKVRALEKAARSDAPKPDPKEIKELKERVDLASAALTKRNTEYTELEKMYKTEQQYCQSLQGARPTSAPAAALDRQPPPEESTFEDSAIIRMYEDITELSCVAVKVREGKYGPKDKVLDFNCILSPVGGSCINFRLRTYKELDPVKHAQRAKNPYDSIVLFTPELSRETDMAFIQRLGRFREEVQFKQEELAGVMRDLGRRVMGRDE